MICCENAKICGENQLWKCKKFLDVNKKILIIYLFKAELLFNDHRIIDYKGHRNFIFAPFFDL